MKRNECLLAMKIMKVVINLVILSLFLHQCGVEARKTLSDEEDMELERQLAILNKPPIKSFQIKNDIYDCIDIYRQPAFDHPLLKNHEIQMKPTYEPGQLIHQASSRKKVVLMEISCPVRTVPIRRTQKEDLIRVKHLSNNYATGIHPSTVDRPGQHVAGVRPSENSSIYHGIHANINVYKLQIKPDQYTTAQMWIEKGSPDQFSSLQAGWVVAPALTGDNDTHIFVYWAVNTNNSKTGCYNQLCPGFVQVHPKYGPGSPIGNGSTYGGVQFEIEMAVFQDNTSGNWWLRLNDTINLGYWPKAIIPQFSNGASYVAWGGSAVGSPNDSPPMGNGHYPHGDYTKACYIHELSTFDASNKQVVPAKDGMLSFADNRKCYGVEYEGMTDWGLSLLIGGPGGNCGV